MAEKSKSGYVLIAIGVYSLVKAAGLVLVAVGAHKLLGGNVATVLKHWAEAVRVDPGSRLAHAVIGKITGLSSDKLRALEVGTLVYAVIFCVEGTGLVLRKRWAEYVTILSTVTFLPIEAFEIYDRVSTLKIGVFVANVLMVIYLFWNLRRHESKAGGFPVTS